VIDLCKALRANLFVMAALVATAGRTSAQDYKPEDPIPPGATGKILPVSGKVTEIKGLASAVAGKVAGLEAALKDLSAKVTEQEIRIELAADVLFDFDKANLRPEAGPALEKVAAVLKSYPNATTTIEGHTDSVGNETYNQGLSERRAVSVKSWLSAHGIGNPMTTRGWGKRKGVAPNTKPDGSDNPEGRQKNRRVEITVKKR
jgi:outer membrane protein OmpA-like peptidoglycan-associated protein